MQQCERGREAVVRDAKHSNLAVVVGNVLEQPFDRVVGIGSLVGGLRVVQIDPGRKVEHSLGLEASPQVLEDENVAVLREFFQGSRDLLGSFLGHTVRRAAKQNGQRTLRIDRSEDCCLQMNSIPRSEEHTSELQSLRHLVCRLLLEKKKTD